MGGRGDPVGGRGALVGRLGALVGGRRALVGGRGSCRAGSAGASPSRQSNFGNVDKNEYQRTFSQ